MQYVLPLLISVLARVTYGDNFTVGPLCSARHGRLRGVNWTYGTAELEADRDTLSRVMGEVG